MTNRERASLELSQIIQPGDSLALSDGSRSTAAGYPANQAAYRRGHSWIVSIVTSWGFMPISLCIVDKVERDGRVVWSIEWERVPVQRELF